MAKATFRIDPHKFQAVQERIAKAMQEKMEAAGQQLLEQAQARVPVLTGDLRRSLQLRIEREDNRITVSVGSSLRYARAVELGTNKMRARPYLRRALYGDAWRKLIGK